MASPKQRLALVEFKRKRRAIVKCDVSCMCGQVVVTVSDKGQDAGSICDIWETEEDYSKLTMSIVRPLTRLEYERLIGEHIQMEKEILVIAQKKIDENTQLQMTIIDVEMQFDGHKITFYYESNTRQDFRELVKDLFKLFRARIWFEKANTHNNNSPTIIPWLQSLPQNIRQTINTFPQWVVPTQETSIADIMTANSETENMIRFKKMLLPGY